ncbi:MAG TPA: SPOR domain-containing protein [Rhodanobacteraceae bacterium]|nr:SPOR domain-containing protein [Rhodanobacteraceae bacterium]
MDSGLKKRLLGAVVLIALAVIFVPMLLPGHSNSGSQSVSMKIPPEPSGELQTRILQVGPDAASAGSSAQATLVDPDHVATLDLSNRAAQPRSAASSLPIAATNAPVTSAPVASAPVASPTSAFVAQAPAASNAVSAPEVAKAPPAASANAGPLPGGAGAAAGTIYSVNLGVYANHASADKLVAKAKQNGFSALATPETLQGKSVTRVRVGPFHSRAEAEAARLKLKDIERVSMTVESGTVNQNGDAPSSAIAAGQSGAWAVQLAAFSDESSANKLRDRLRGQGFDGYVDSVKTSKGKLWRVRAGPFATRNVAESTRGQIADKLKISGNIVAD